MIGSNAYNYINVLNKAANASWVRNEVIVNNLANNTTPDYKRKDIVFEPFLEKELLKDSFSDADLDKRVASINLENLTASIYTDQEELSYRYDGNNVDTPIEEANLAQNQIRYLTLLDSMTQEFNRIKEALTRV